MNDKLILNPTSIFWRDDSFDLLKENKKLLQNAINTSSITILNKFTAEQYNNSRGADENTFLALYYSKNPFIFVNLRILTMEERNNWAEVKMDYISPPKILYGKYLDKDMYVLVAYKSDEDQVVYNNKILIHATIMEFSLSNKYKLNNIFS